MNVEILKHKHQILALQRKQNLEKIQKISQHNLEIEKKMNNLLVQIKKSEEASNLAKSRVF